MLKSMYHLARLSNEIIICKLGCCCHVVVVVVVVVLRAKSKLSGGQSIFDSFEF